MSLQSIFHTLDLKRQLIFNLLINFMVQFIDLKKKNRKAIQKLINLIWNLKIKLMRS